MKKFICKNFKKLNIFFLIFALAFLGGCGSTSEPQSAKIKVVAVNFAQYDFARAVCQNLAEVKMIMRPGAEVHGYEPSLSDIIAIRQADVFIYGGGESDVWVDEILSSMDIQKKTVIPLMNSSGVRLYNEDTATHSHSHGEHHHEEHMSKEHHDEYDEHIWTSPKNAMAIVDIICDAVSEKDKKNSDLYRKNADSYINRLKTIDKGFADMMESSKTNFIVFADRFPFLYMVKDYGISYMAAFSGCSPESDAGPKVISEIIEEMEHHGLDTVFYIELSNEKMADAICEYTGAKKLLLHSSQSISKDDFESGVTYAELMENNLCNLREAL